jgi:hypothetical protein
MESKFVGAGFVLALVGLLAPACGGDDAPITSTEADAGADVAVAVDATGGDDTSVAGECVVNDDCTARLPVTTPPGCAVATCDTLQKKCHFKSKDTDGDGHTAKACSAATATIETGDDCDDADNKSYPGAWDGPSTSPDGGAADPDRCDQKDNDCNGSPDDGKVSVDGGSKTCKCDPSAPLPCYEYPNGAPIDATTLDASNNPKGACKKGTRTCPNGVPGTCVGAIGPEASEQCDNLDRDCDGVSGNAGDTVSTAPVWYKDTDSDNFGDMATTPKQQCVSPAGLWKLFIPNTDCDDNDGANTPGKAEVCDGKDNNCNVTVDEGVQTNFCADVDTDGYCTAACTMACTAPAGYRPQNTCSAGVDCNDGSLDTHPTAYEYCGDGVDSNCGGGDSETFPNLNQSCTAGTFGVCRRTGNYVCTAAKTGTACNATAGTAGSGASVASSDPGIDMTQARSGYDPRWDYNCDNNQSIAETGIYGSYFRSNACGGNYQAACATLTDQTSCNAGVFGAKFFNCEHYPANSFYYTDPTSPTQMCGRNVNYISCLWQFNGGSGCDYLANTYTANNHAVSCN